MPSQKKLFLFTLHYPYGTGESFIENELKLLSEDFQTIYLFPLTNRGEARPLPAQNIKVVYLFEKQKIQKWKLLLNNFILIFQILFFEFRSTSSTINFLKSLSLLKSILLINIHRANILNEFITGTKEKGNNIVFYSFWTDDWATVLSILKKKKAIDTFFTRGHGYDIYEERWKMGIIPFRNFQLANLSTFFTVSKDALNYMINHYPHYKSKFKLSYLTIPYSGENPFYENNSTFTIVSCSSLIPIKRVELIIEIFKNVKKNVNWIHFGDGPLKQNLMEQVKNLKPNIIVNFKGQVSNNDILNFYKTHPVNLFIHLSETEGGAPVALQEAASFSIPLLGTDAGGIPEIVTEETGILIPVNFNIKEVAESIEKFETSFRNTAAFREKVRKFWFENFNPEINYNILRDEML